MARIRSIHPGLFTDEAFMAASMPARILLIGIWTEAWDDGVFEWKPIVLKARIFPADTVDVIALLAELEALNFIRKVDRNGRGYGLIRNFKRYQRPKKPNQSGIISELDADYVGRVRNCDDTGSEPVPHQFPTGTEKSPQMEDGGGRGKRKREEEEERNTAQPESEAAPARDLDSEWAAQAVPGQCSEVKKKILQAMGLVPKAGLLPKGHERVDNWLRDGLDPDRDIIPLIRERQHDAAEKGAEIRSIRYYDQALTELGQKRAHERALANDPGAKWRHKWRHHWGTERGFRHMLWVWIYFADDWRVKDFGPDPGKPHSAVSERWLRYHLLDETYRRHLATVAEESRDQVRARQRVAEILTWAGYPHTAGTVRELALTPSAKPPLDMAYITAIDKTLPPILPDRDLGTREAG